MKRTLGILRPLNARLNARLRRFARADGGASSVEAVIWMPVFILLIGIVTDASMIFGGQAEVLRVVQDANRSLSVGRFLTIDATETYVLAQIATVSPNATVTTTVTSGIITTTVLMPVGDLAPTGIVDAFSSLNLTVSADFMSEV